MNLPKINSYDKNAVIENYNFNKTLIQERVKNKNSKKVYVAALGSFPYLFLLGSLFKNAYSHINILDYDRHASGGGRWYKLPFSNEESRTVHHELVVNSTMSIDERINELNDSSIQEVAIALSYTFGINKDAIPEDLKNNTLYLKHSLGIGHDKLSDEESQRELLKELSSYMATLWNNHEKRNSCLSSIA